MLRKFEKSKFGTLASCPKLPEVDWSISPYDQYGSAATMNTTGTMLCVTDFVVDAFIEFAQYCTLPLLDVGAGYGVATISALAKGATVIANDIDARHLLVLRHNTPDDHRSRLYLKQGSAQELDFPKDSFDAIIFRRVIHFLLGDEIEAIIAKSARWIKSGGYLFIVTMAPYHQYIPGFIETYEQRWQAGIQWPGVITNLRDYTPNLAPEIPDFIHVMDERPLARAVVPYFNIQVSQLFDYQPQPFLKQHRAFYGLIAKRR